MACSTCTCRGIEIDTKNNTVTSVSESSQKLTTTDWLQGYDSLNDERQWVEIRFKNTRKEYYQNTDSIDLIKGDMVAVESAFGHDIGIVSLTGKMAWLQVRKKVNMEKYTFRKIYRKAKPNDIRTYKAAVDRENNTLIKARQHIKSLNLNMKLGDVEYQGDGSKAIFYYIAEERVDFRELIKVLAREFHIRIEMKQIGVRQEAGRIGGIGSCGRELCCSSWKTNFQSVTLEAAKVQDLPSNAQKLAGQCGKLKCCLMYELDSYLEAKEGVPKILLELDTNNGKAYHVKTDLLKRMMYYSFEEGSMSDLVAVPVDRVKEFIELNKKGIKVDILDTKSIPGKKHIEYTHAEDSIHRFDKQIRKRNKRRNVKRKHS